MTNPTCKTCRFLMILLLTSMLTVSLAAVSWQIIKIGHKYIHEHQPRQEGGKS